MKHAGPLLVFGAAGGSRLHLLERLREKLQPSDETRKLDGKAPQSGSCADSTPHPPRPAAPPSGEGQELLYASLTFTKARPGACPGQETSEYSQVNTKAPGLRAPRHGHAPHGARTARVTSGVTCARTSPRVPRSLTRPAHLLAAARTGPAHARRPRVSPGSRPHAGDRSASRSAGSAQTILSDEPKSARGRQVRPASNDRTLQQSLRGSGAEGDRRTPSCWVAPEQVETKMLPVTVEKTEARRGQGPGH
ncbi:hypothetical protein J0S82_008784 [Galemys pyrenaicus]|uniref:Uncharacterized protein n=1 Tax=Galemys pyrenaicus TaxID=202257 RepID=A0A8J6A2B1_GALPY|nr:hypothetical protein J0S82_008784 [Galemys pyrenaicus]